MALGSSGNELLWIIDIYSLVMAGMVLPMGALGDKIGFKRLLLLGSAIFGIASLCAALSPTAMTLIASRALLAVGAAMIVPATLAGIRSTFAEASQRNMALGLWAAVGSGGAAFGPLVGGILLEHFYWGSVFLINVPIVLVVIAINAKVVPRQPARREQPLNLLQALVLIAAILMLVFSAKSALKASGAVAHRAGGARRGGDVNLVYPQAAVGGPPDGGYAPVHPSHNLKRGDDGDDGPDYPGRF